MFQITKKCVFQHLACRRTRTSTSSSTFVMTRSLEPPYPSNFEEEKNFVPSRLVLLFIVVHKNGDKLEKFCSTIENEVISSDELID